MINLIVTILSEIAMSLQITRLLEVVSICVVFMLLCSPGIVATIMGVSTKLGIYSHIKGSES